MAIALQVNGLSKRYHAGTGRCGASAHVLRAIDLSVRAGEVVALVGESGSGKSTLLLCLAGLSAPDSGAIRWFGDESRTAASRRAVYHVAPTDLMRGGCVEQPSLHLVDISRNIDCGDLAHWISIRRSAGDAVVVASRDFRFACSLRARVLRITRGELVEQRDLRPSIRVAESDQH
jgi:ABC-type phosphate/phosphonate transport system ATPase subunit